MGRPNSLAQTAGSTTIHGLYGGQPPSLPVNVATGVSYGVAGEVLSISNSNMYSTYSETRGYNSLLQLTSIGYSDSQLA